MDLLYRLVLAVAWPLVLLYFAYRVVRQPAYFRTLGERVGILPRSFHQTASGAIWLHAVSVGEILAAVELIRALRKMLPEAAVFVSTTTLAGRRLADQKLLSIVDGIFFTPLDLPICVRAVFRRLKPNVLVVMETEIWPTLYREAKRSGCGLILVNARVSDRALPSYLRWSWFFRRVLARPDLILAQSEAMKERYLQIGAPDSRLQVSGNLKYDVQPPPVSQAVREFVESLQPAQVWIAASTMPPDEDDTVIDTFRRLSAAHPRLLLILAPRKPERFDLVAGKLAEARIRFARRTQLPANIELPGVLLLDTIGELAGLFSLAEVVFVGGSIVEWGGHNLLEPAIFGKPIVTGKHMMNFREMADEFIRKQACMVVPDAASLAPAVERILRDGAFARSLGERARRCAETERGATGITAEAIRRLYDESLPEFHPPLDWTLWPLARLWQAGVAIDRWRTTPARLDVPVISIGNLTVGGTAKTPMVLRVAGELPGVAILTRGYGRKSHQSIVLEPGSQATVEETGDEAQAYLRRGHAVGIGSDRVAAARRMKASGFVLDDGFQHWRLERDLEIVLIDALDPTGGGDVLPRGRLRERPSALARADILVMTRSRRRRPGIESWLRRYNAKAPIFYAWLEPVGWIHGKSGERTELPEGVAAAACGLGNPESFWQTLRALGVGASRTAFPDHHDYTAEDVKRALASADYLLTTEKDWVKMQRVGLSNVYWLEVEMRFDRERELWDIIRGRCKPASLGPG